MRLLMAAALAVALAAGCLDGSSPADGTPGSASCPVSPLDQPGLRIVDPSVDPIVDDKALAEDFQSTNVRTCSLPAIGHTPLREAAQGGPHKYIGEVDMRGDLGLGAVAVLGNGEAGGVYLVDISDRASPEPIAFIPQPGAYVVDVKFSDDGAVLYVASQATPSAELLGAVPELVAPSGFTVYSLADPTQPSHFGFVLDEQLGCHMLDPVQVAPTQDAVMCVSTNLKSYLIERGPTFANLGFVEYVPQRGGVPTPALPVGLPGDLPVSAAQGPHDMTAFHEGGSFGAGASYLVVSHWGEGVKVLDITNAPLITEVGSWDGEGAEYYFGNVHTAMMFDTADGRYIVATPELTFEGAVPALWVLDANDLSSLTLLAEWVHPGLHESQGLYLTTHQWQVAPTGPDVAPGEVRVYLTMNHGGLWVLDLGHILLDHDQAAVLGFNLARLPITDPEPVGNAILNTWDVNVVDGYVYGSDRATGLWVFHYQGDELGDARLTGFA